MAKQTLGLELKQQQKLSPLQIQTIKLLELPVQDLEQRIRKEIEDNPVLEEDTRAEDENREDGEKQPREVSLSTIKDDSGSIPGYKLKVNNWGPDPRPTYDTFSVKETFTENLMDQLGFKDLTPHERDVAKFIIGSLDGRGYLTRDILSLVDDLALAGIGTDEKEALRMLKVVQEFEPTGVGARDLRECLLLQLRAEKPSRETENAIEILEDHFNEFTNRHFQKILTRMGLDEDEFKAAVKRITRLNPSPGGQNGETYEDKAQQIIPDFVLSFENERFDLRMPRFSIPELKVNKRYAQMLLGDSNCTEKERQEAELFVKKKMDSAKWFVEAIRQRHNTLDRTMRAILDFQKDYFKDGDVEKLRPMVLRDIAEITGFDISTISRVVNSKYIQTHFGIFSLKEFFSEGLANQDGEEVSTKEIKNALTECISSEDKRHPLTDDQLVQELAGKGYNIARRTIAKYRDQLNIPTARLRKDL